MKKIKIYFQNPYRVPLNGKSVQILHNGAPEEFQCRPTCWDSFYGSFWGQSSINLLK